jgi:hypothetical protein
MKHTKKIDTSGTDNQNSITCKVYLMMITNISTLTSLRQGDKENENIQN